MIGYQTKNIPAAASLKDVDQKQGIITGYFSHFGNEDSDGDTIMQGAFAKTIKEQGPQSNRPRIKHLRNHSVYEPIGNITVLKEDQTGLYYESQPGTHAIGQDTIKMIESGLITEHSIGFETVKKQVVDPDADWRNRKQILQELKLWEGSSLTGWGANELAGGAVMKGMDIKAYLKILEDRQKALEKFCRNSTATDDTIEMLLIECKQLSQIIFDLTSKRSTEPETDSTLPEADVKQLIKQAFEPINSHLNTWQNGIERRTAGGS